MKLYSYILATELLPKHIETVKLSVKEYCKLFVQKVTRTQVMLLEAHNLIITLENEL